MLPEVVCGVRKAPREFEANRKRRRWRRRGVEGVEKGELGTYSADASCFCRRLRMAPEMVPRNDADCAACSA